MSLDKAIQHGKEKRKPYRGAAAWDSHCRNNNYCSWCRDNRMHKHKKKECACKAQVDDVYLMDDVDKSIQEFWEEKHTEYGTQEESTNGITD